MVAALTLTAGTVVVLADRSADDPTVTPVSDTALRTTTSSSTTSTTTTIAASEAVLDTLTLEQKAGQVLVTQFSGQPDAAVLDQLATGRAGSVFVVGRSGNLTDIEGTAAMIGSLQQAAATNDVGLLVATDQEGGRVQQVTVDGLTTWPAAARYGDIAAGLGAAEAAEITRLAHETMATELAALGVNVDFAPVADVNVVGNQGAIRDRSFSADPIVAADLTAAAVEGLAAGGVGATAKHFPGHGATGVDSHRQLPEVELTRDQWLAADALPFVAAIEADVPLVMVGHLHYPAFDPAAEPRPASLSPVIVTDLLRTELGFDGVVVTDDLGAMVPVAGLPIDQLVVDALRAGVDLLLTPGDVDAAHAAIVAAVTDGRVDEASLDAAVTRILALKQRLGVLDPPPPPTTPPVIEPPLVRLALSHSCQVAGTRC